MSVTSSLLLLLILLSLLEVDGRRVGPVEMEQKRSNTSSSIDKVGEKARSYESNSEVTPQKGKPASKENLPDAASNNGMGTPFNVKTKELHGKDAWTRILMGSKRKGSKVHAQDSSLVSVSWLVPRGKPSHKQPGFNLDYSPPKTHPPSHN